MAKEYIEREAAIEKLNRLCDRVCQYSKAQRQYMCGACPLGDAFTVIEDDIPAADVRPVEWIPVTERLPEEYVNVLCHLRSLGRQSEYYSIDHLMEDGQWWKAANSWKHEVTHWMPLPQPPKEE